MNLKNNKKILISISLIFIFILGLTYFLIVKPIKVCSEKADIRMKEISETQSALMSYIKDDDLRREILYKKCLSDISPIPNNNLLDLLNSLVSALVLSFLIFLFLFLFDGNYENNKQKLSKALLLTLLLNIAFLFGNLFGIYAPFITLLLGIFAVMYVLNFTHGSAFLFIIALNLATYLLVFLIVQVLMIF